MSRKNIFDIVEDDFNIKNETYRVMTLFTHGCIANNVSIRTYINKHMFEKWPYKHTSLNLYDFESRIDTNLKYSLDNKSFVSYSHPDDLSNYLIILEYLYNMFYLFKICSERDYIALTGITTLEKGIYNLNYTLEKINFEAKEIEPQKYILVEKNAAATAVAEIVDTELAKNVIEYNHYILKGYLERKRQILRNLWDKYEPMSNILKNKNHQLVKDIGYLYNNFNIRHNNKSKGQHYKEYIYNINEEELEYWYDETYQMTLLAILEHDNITRSVKLLEFKQKVGEK